MIFLYIFLGFLVLVLFLQWDKYENQYRFHDWIDSVKNTCLLKPFRFLTPCLLALPRKTWKCLKPLLRFIFQKAWIGITSWIPSLPRKIWNCIKSSTLWQWAWPRPLILFSSTLLIIVLYGLVNFFHDSKNNDDKRNLIFKILVPEDADRTIYNTLIPILLGAIPAFFIWSWRNNDKRKDQEQREKELKQKDRELNFHEKNYDRDKFSEYQDILEDGSNTANKRFSTTYELDYYYNKSGTYPQMVHTFLKENLKAYWRKHKTDTQAPIYIKAIYDVLDKQDKIFVSKELSLSGFHLNFYKTSRKDLSNLDLSEVIWNQAELQRTNLSNTILECASFQKAKLSGSILQNANM